MNIHFADNGVLPGKFNIRIKPVYATRNMLGLKDLNLYYVEGNTHEEVSTGVTMNLDDYYDLEIEHNSDYWLIDKEIKDPVKTGNVPETNNPEVNNPGTNNSNSSGTTVKTGDDTNMTLWMGVLMGTILCAGVTLRALKKHELE